MNVVFHNNFHRGDCFYSRSFVKDIISKYPADNYYYLTNYNDNIFKDLGIQMVTNQLLLQNILEIAFFKEKDDIFINTWIGHSNRKYTYEVSLKSNYDMYKNTYDSLNIKLDSIENYIPVVDFDFVEKDNIDTFMLKYKDKLKIFISNGDVMSGQSTNFDFNPIISFLATMYKDVLFILTHENVRLVKDNVFYTKDIIQSNSDMLELSYLSTYCDIIVGRASGPYCFTNIQDNFNNPNKVFIGFCYARHLLWYENNISKTVWSNNLNVEDVTNTILNEIKQKL